MIGVPEPGEVANPFGLHDALGNVSEWTASHPSSYKDGWTPRPATLKAYMARGGNFNCGPEVACSAYRALSNRPEFVLFSLGVRPARAIARQ